MKFRCMMFFMGLGLLVYWFLPLSSVQSVTWTPQDERLDTAVFDELLSYKWLFTPSRVFEEKIEALPTVRQATLKKKLFGHLVFELTLREPFAAVVSGGYCVIVDHNGHVLEVTDEPGDFYPIIGFNVTSSRLGHPIVTSELDLIEKAVQLVYLLDEYTEIHPEIVLKNGDLIQSLGETYQVNFGQAPDVVRQFAIFMEIYETQLNRGVSSGIINVSNPDDPINQPWR